jgi:hypothetical protein
LLGLGGLGLLTLRGFEGGLPAVPVSEPVLDLLRVFFNAPLLQAVLYDLDFLRCPDQLFRGRGQEAFRRFARVRLTVGRARRVLLSILRLDRNVRYSFSAESRNFGCRNPPLLASGKIGVDLAHFA